jgi:GST-like protein
LPPGTGSGLALGEQAEETEMIDLYYWPTPNDHKITMFLEEAGLDYAIHPVDISAGDQFRPDFLAISPNNRMPAIIDTVPSDGGEPISVFESGAILLYFAEKTGRFLPKDVRGRKAAAEWLFLQVGGWDRWPDRTTISASTRQAEFPMRSTVT